MDECHLGRVCLRREAACQSDKAISFQTAEDSNRCFWTERSTFCNDFYANCTLIKEVNVMIIYHSRLTAMYNYWLDFHYATWPSWLRAQPLACSMSRCLHSREAGRSRSRVLGDCECSAAEWRLKSESSLQTAAGGNDAMVCPLEEGQGLYLTDLDSLFRD